MSRIIDLEQRSQFRILLHPVRQEIVHLLRRTGHPMSANAVAKRMELSPVSAQSHLKKLVELGILLTEERQGSQGGKVVLYALDDVDIRLHLGRKDLFQGEREAMAANVVDGTFRGIINTTHLQPEEEMERHILFRFGALHLSSEQRAELTALVTGYLSSHSAPLQQGEEHWEYVVMAYRAPDEPRR